MATAVLYCLLILGFNSLYPFVADSGDIVLIALVTAILMACIQLPRNRAWKLLRFLNLLSVGIILVQPYFLPWMKARVEFYPKWLQHINMIVAPYVLFCVLHWVVEWPDEKSSDRLFRYMPQGEKETI